MSEKPRRLQTNPKSNTRACNAARVSPLSGRHVPTKYSSPLDTSHLMSPEEFHNRFIRNKPGNVYTGNKGIVEESEHDQLQSPETPVTTSSVSNSQRSETQTSLGSSTYHENVEEPPAGW
jgi:hypothetical protein